MFEIVEKKVLSPVVNLFRIKAPSIAKKRKAGQFVIFQIDETGERVPLTIADSSPEEGTVTIICQALGKSTIKLNSLNKGNIILNLAGPLGIPSHIENFGTSVCIGGGVGIAVAYPLAKALKEKGNNVISIMGFRSRELLFMEEELKATSNELHVTTDDGTYARKGLVTDVLKEILEKDRKVDFVLAVGPVPMMKAVCNITKSYKIKTMVSLNPVMVDGTGMCGACRVTINGKTKFVCVDGPEFDGHHIDFDELMKRQSFYKEYEKLSYEKFQHEGCCSEAIKK